MLPVYCQVIKYEQVQKIKHEKLRKDKRSEREGGRKFRLLQYACN